MGRLAILHILRFFDEKTTVLIVATASTKEEEYSEKKTGLKRVSEQLPVERMEYRQDKDKEDRKKRDQNKFSMIE